MGQTNSRALGLSAREGHTLTTDELNAVWDSVAKGRNSLPEDECLEFLQRYCRATKISYDDKRARKVISMVGTRMSSEPPGRNSYRVSRTAFRAFVASNLLVSGGALSASLASAAATATVSDSLSPIRPIATRSVKKRPTKLFSGDEDDEDPVQDGAALARTLVSLRAKLEPGSRHLLTRVGTAPNPFPFSFMIDRAAPLLYEQLAALAEHQPADFASARRAVAQLWVHLRHYTNTLSSSPLRADRPTSFPPPPYLLPEPVRLAWLSALLRPLYYRAACVLLLGGIVDHALHPPSPSENGGQAPQGMMMLAAEQQLSDHPSFGPIVKALATEVVKDGDWWKDYRRRHSSPPSAAYYTKHLGRYKRFLFLAASSSLSSLPLSPVSDSATDGKNLPPSPPPTPVASIPLLSAFASDSSSAASGVGLGGGVGLLAGGAPEGGIPSFASAPPPDSGIGVGLLAGWNTEPPAPSGIGFGAVGLLGAFTPEPEPPRAAPAVAPSGIGLGVGLLSGWHTSDPDPPSSKRPFSHTDSSAAPLGSGAGGVVSIPLLANMVSYNAADDEVQNEEARQRLLLARLSSVATVRTMLEPDIDIDIMWHTHMVHPLSYAADCVRLCGRIVDHVPWPDADEADRVANQQLTRQLMGEDERRAPKAIIQVTPMQPGARPVDLRPLGPQDDADALFFLSVPALPVDALAIVCSFLDLPSLSRLARCSRACFRAACSDFAWKDRPIDEYRRLVGLPPASDEVDPTPLSGAAPGHARDHYMAACVAVLQPAVNEIQLSRREHQVCKCGARPVPESDPCCEGEVDKVLQEHAGLFADLSADELASVRREVATQMMLVPTPEFLIVELLMCSAHLVRSVRALPSSAPLLSAAVAVL